MILRLFLVALIFAVSLFSFYSYSFSQNYPLVRNVAPTPDTFDWCVPPCTLTLGSTGEIDFADVNVSIRQSAANSLTFETSGVDRITIDNAGNLNLLNPSIIYFGGSTNTISLPAANSLALKTNNVERVRVNSSGGVIITLSGIPVYANNAAAVAGGLSNGQLYRTNADPDFIAIVH